MDFKSFDDLPQVCPECGKPAMRLNTSYGRKDICPDCGLWSWAGKTLVSAATHAARQRAHKIFDKLWQSGRMTRKQAYQWLQGALGLSYQPHMAEMDVELARRVVQVVKEFELSSL